MSQVELSLRHCATMDRRARGWERGICRTGIDARPYARRRRVDRSARFVFTRRYKPITVANCSFPTGQHSFFHGFHLSVTLRPINYASRTTTMELSKCPVVKRTSTRNYATNTKLGKNYESVTTYLTSYEKNRRF